MYTDEQTEQRRHVNTQEMLWMHHKLPGVVILPIFGAKYGVRSNLMAGGWSIVDASTGQDLVFVSMDYSLREAVDVAFNLFAFGRDNRGFALPGKA